MKEKYLLVNNNNNKDHSASESNNNDNRNTEKRNQNDGDAVLWLSSSFFSLALIKKVFNIDVELKKADYNIIFIDLFVLYFKHKIPLYISIIFENKRENNAKQTEIHIYY